MNKALALVIASCWVSGSPAMADWQYTRWGMTPAQVQKASKGTAKASSEVPEELVSGTTYQLVAPYTAGEFQFKAHFAFDSQKHLSLVLLDLTSGEPASLLMSLTRKYGDARRPGPLDWQWRTARDVISFSPTKNGGHLIYGRLAGPAEKGL